MNASELYLYDECNRMSEGLSLMETGGLSEETLQAMRELERQLQRFTIAAAYAGAGVGGGLPTERDPEVDEVDPDELAETETDEEELADTVADFEEVVAATTWSATCITIKFLSQQDGALLPFSLSTHPPTDPDDEPDIDLYDSAGERTWRNWRTVDELADLIGDVVWANLTEYKLGHGYQIGDVMRAVGIPGPWGKITWADALETARSAHTHRNDNSSGSV